jgi:hypothetical protein
VYPFHRIYRRERQRSRQHLVENDAERVEIAAGIDRAVHPSGLFRRHISKRTRDDFRRRRHLVLAEQPRGDAETSQPDAAAGRVYEDVCGLEVLMDQPTRMRMRHGRRERDGEAQESADFELRSGHPIECPTAGIRQHQHHPPALRPQFQRMRGPG